MPKQRKDTAIFQRRFKIRTTVSNAQHALSRLEKTTQLRAIASGMSAQCPHCSCLFRHRSALKLHLRLRHKWTTQRINRYRLSVQRAIRDSRTSRFKRDYNQKLTATVKLRNRLIRHRPKGQVFACGCCSKVFLTKRSCRQHKLAHAGCRGGHRRLHCVHCARTFLHNGPRTQHARRDHSRECLRCYRYVISALVAQIEFVLKVHSQVT